MARDRAEIQADISAVRSLIRQDLDAAGVQLRRGVKVVGALLGAATIVGIVTSRSSLAPVLRGTLTAALTAYRVASVLAAVGQWVDRGIQRVDASATRRRRPAQRAASDRRRGLDGKGPSRQRVIVAATEMPLYHSLRAVLGRRDGIDIVLDRRREGAGTWPGLERRERPEIDAEIRSTGWARVVLPLTP